MKLSTLLLILILAIPAEIFCQYELYTATKIQEIILGDKVFAFAAENLGDTIFPFDSFINEESRGNLTGFDDVKEYAKKFALLSTDDQKVLQELYSAYYFQGTINDSINYEQIKHIVTTFDSKANFHGQTSLTGFGISQSAVLTAIADVIVDRAKRELASTYFDRWAKEIAKGIPVTYHDKKLTFAADDNSATDRIKLDKILPNIYTFLKNSTDYMSSGIGQTFRSALISDMVTLLPNFIEYGLPDLYKIDKRIDDYALATYTFAKKLCDNATFYITADEFLSDLLNSIPENPTETENFLKFMKVLNTSLVDNNGVYQVNAAAFRNSNPVTFRIYLHLLSQNTDIPESLRRILNDDSKRELFNHLMAEISRVDLLSRDLSDFDNSQDKISAISTMIHCFFDAVDSGIEIYQAYANDTNVLKDVSQILNQSAVATDFLTAVNVRNYSGAALSLISFIGQAFDDDIDPHLLKYITLISDISQAQDADEVRTIFDNAILPVGSYAIKRSTSFSVSVNSFVGLAGGNEWSVFNRQYTGRGASVGFALPIGIAANWSRGDEDTFAASHSVFVSLLDLGAIANYNLNSGASTSTSIESAPEITFANVFSPGLAYVLGCKKSPIAFMLGAQYMPRLREIKGPDDIRLGTADALQFRLGILVDVPLFNVMMKGPNK